VAGPGRHKLSADSSRGGETFSSGLCNRLHRTEEREAVGEERAGDAADKADDRILRLKDIIEARWSRFDGSNAADDLEDDLRRQVV
jgi:hypothetical protein